MGTLSELVVNTTRSVANFSVVIDLEGVGDSHDVAEGGWEVQEERFNSLGNLSFAVEEREVSGDEFLGFTLDLLVVTGDDADVFVDIGDDGNDRGEVFIDDGLLESRESASQVGGVVDEASVMVNNNGGVCFFNESLNTEEEAVDINSNLLWSTNHGNNIFNTVELSVVGWDFEGVENEELEHFSEVLTGGNEVTVLEGVLQGVEFRGERHEVGEETSGDLVLSEGSEFLSDGVEEGSEGSDGLSA